MEWVFPWMQKLKALLCLELVGEREISLYSKSIWVCVRVCVRVCGYACEWVCWRARERQWVREREWALEGKSICMWDLEERERERERKIKSIGVCDSERCPSACRYESNQLDILKCSYRKPINIIAFGQLDKRRTNGFWLKPTRQVATFHQLESLITSLPDN